MFFLRFAWHDNIVKRWTRSIQYNKIPESTPPIPPRDPVESLLLCQELDDFDSDSSSDLPSLQPLNISPVWSTNSAV